MARERQATSEEIELWLQVMNGTAKIERQPLSQPPQARPPKPRPQPVPSRTVDLHGLTLAQAHDRILAQLDLWKGLTRSLVFVTGKSGLIRQEFSRWLQHHSAVSRIETLNGGGAFRVYYHKTRLNKA